jgi:teichuronic acid exporter
MVSQVITWAITLVVIRLLTPADYGLLAMATVFVSLLVMFSELGLGAAVVQQAEVDLQLLKRVFGVILVIHFSLAALLMLSAPLIGALYDEPRVIPVIRVLSLQFVLAGFAVIPDAQLQRRMEFRNRSLLDFSGAIVASLATLAMAFSGAGVWALVAGSILSQVWKTIGINWLSPFLHWPDFSVKGLRSLLRFGGHFTAVQVFWMFLSQVDIFICAKLLGKEVLGFYSVAMHLASLPSQKISGLVNQVAFPTFSRMQDDLPKVGANVLLGVRILSFFAFPVSWGMSSIAPEIVEMVLGAKWATSVLPLQVLALIIPLRMLGNFVATAIQGIGRSDIVLRNVVWASLTTPPAFFIGANWWGLLGLSLAWLAVSPLVFLQSMMRGLPALGLRLGQLASAMMPAAGASLVMYGAVTVARQMLSAGQGGGLRLGVLVGVGALAYCAVSFGVNRNGTREVFDLMRSIATARRQKLTEA